MNSFWIKGFPLPPTVNKSLFAKVSNKMSFSKNGKPYRKARLVKSDSSRQYSMDCLIWRSKNSEQFNMASETMKTWMANYEAEKKILALRLDLIFVLHKSKLISKENKPKAYDVDNRIKPCLDQVKGLLGLDDKHFFSVASTKATTEDMSQQQVLIRVGVAHIENFDRNFRTMICG